MLCHTVRDNFNGECLSMRGKHIFCNVEAVQRRVLTLSVVHSQPQCILVFILSPICNSLHCQQTV